MTLIALLAVGAIGYLLVPTSGPVSAQSSESVERDVQHLESFEPVGSNQAATTEMISSALSNRTGNLSDMVSSIKQLPCTEVGGDLAGKKFGAGVYCVSSARLAGNMVLDGGGDANAIFIFNVKGSLEAMDASNINLVNEAKSYNVFFAADSATIGEESNFRAAIFTNKAIQVNGSARVAGRLASLTGQVDAPEGVVASPDGGGNGNLEICKRVLATPTNTGNLENRIFNFTVTGANIPVAITASVRAGFCSSDLEVPNGPAVITELNITNRLDGTPVVGNFALTGVRALSANPTSGGSSLNLATLNLATRTVGITIANGTSLNQLSVEFTNVFAITGFIEICKRAAFIDGSTTIIDPDVAGTFRFTVAGVFVAGSNTVLQIFNVPVGQCTGAIAVTLPFATPSIPTNPREGTVVVTELGEEGSFLVSTSTLPADRAVGVTTFNANGGGSRTVRVLEGDESLETIVFFFNRSRPGQLKICKIAGPGIPLNRIFTFRVRGLGPINAAGTIGNVDTTVEVAAGAPNAQGGGGTCNFVPGFGAGIGLAERQTFVIGSIIMTDELTPVNIGGNPVLVSNITTTSTFAPGSPNLAGRFADVIARRDIVEVTYTNFVFQPTILKVCKIGIGTALGGSFTFDVTLANPVSGGINPPFTVPVTVTAGPAGPQGGNCVIVPTVNGSMSLQGGAFNQGSTVIITERAAAGTVVTGISSTTSILPPFVAGQRTTTLSGEFGIVASVTQVTFTNAPGTTQVCTPSTTVTEGDLFPGGIPSFGVSSGPGSVTVDHVNAGTGLQSLTVVGGPINAVVNIPAFAPGTTAPVTVTFTTPDPNLAVDFTLRSASTFHAANTRVRCVAPAGSQPEFEDGKLQEQ